MTAGTVFFDMIGTCFSFRLLREHLAELGAPPLVLDLWFAQTLRDAFALSHAGGYVPLKDVFAAELGRTLRAAGVESDQEARDQLVALLGQLPPQPGLAEATGRLRDSGWKLVALTQGALETTRRLLDAAGVAADFDAVLSADEVRRTKPHPDVYRLGLSIAVGEPWMLAAHAWDIAGAARAGLRTAFVALDEAEYLPGVYPVPDIVAPSLPEAASRIIAFS